MGNPFKSKPGSKKLNDPASICPLGKAQILVEVYAVDPLNILPRQGIAGVGIAVTGGPTQTTAATTPASGQWRYQPLNPGGYTVTATFPPPDLNVLYDISGVAPIGKNLVAGDAQTAVYLVPSTYTEFIIQDTANQTLPNIPWQLARSPLTGGPFVQYDTGTTGADGKVFRRDVKTGTHKLTVKTLTNPVWSAASAVIDTEITLQAVTDGFAAGDAGTFEILDGRNVNTVLLTVNGAVKMTAGLLRLEAKWKPAAGPFANLNHCRIMFRAKAATAVAYSAPISLLKEETVKFEDNKGRAVDRQVRLYFSDGTDQTVTTVKGKVDLQIPWGDILLAVKLPALTAARVKINAGATPGAVAV
jgi:hypothetical protein